MRYLALCLVVGLFAACDIQEDDRRVGNAEVSPVVQSGEQADYAPLFEIHQLEKVYEVEAATLETLPTFRDKRWAKSKSGIRMRALLGSIGIGSSRVVVHSRDGAPLSLDLSSGDLVHLLKRDRRGRLRFRTLRLQDETYVEEHSRRDVVLVAAEPPGYAASGD